MRVRCASTPEKTLSSGALREDASRSVDLPVARLQLETSELLTVQAMGAALPVILLLVELSTGRIYFVCLNDLIEKVILPQDPEYSSKESKVIHIPLSNSLRAGDTGSLGPLRLYAKRPKLHAAFQKFSYQRHELEFTVGTISAAAGEERRTRAMEEAVEQLRHFLAVVLRYDFWQSTPQWPLIACSHREITGLADVLARGAVHQDPDVLREYLLNQPRMWRDERFVHALDVEGVQEMFFQETLLIWSRLQNLAGVYEELIRESFLPTYLWLRQT